ncbi:hypothetical protein PMIN03_008006 [Paraphaeosphaeria minitans]
MTTEIAASLANLGQLHARSARTQQQIADLQEDQRRLDMEFERQLEWHAQADCRQLASMMHTKLPLELRELIYQYLYLEDGPIPVGSYHFTIYVPEPLRSENNTPPAHSEPFIVIPEGATRQDHSMERDENIVYPDSRLLDPAYLGHAAARDASIYYYKSNMFTVCLLENALSDFLFRDPINNFLGRPTGHESAEPLGIIPINYIRNIEIRVKCEHYFTYATFYEELRDGEKNLMQGIFDALQDFSSHISPAIASQLHVEICMMSACIPLRHGLNDCTYLNVLEAIRKPVYVLKYDLGADVKFIHYDEHCSPFPKNKTAIFQLPKDQWSKEKTAFEAAGIEYSPLQYMLPRMDRGSNGCEFLPDIKESRWGLRNVFDSSCTLPIAEFGTWPNTVPNTTDHRLGGI